MNKEDYVSLEVAKMLKERGFSELCTGCYRNNKFMNINSFNDADMFGGDFYAAPTLYEAQKWLREKHNIHLDVRCTSYCKPLNRCDYMCEIFALSSNVYSDTRIYHKYEKALNAGIIEALKLI